MSPEDEATANIENFHHIVPKISKRMMILSLVAKGYDRANVSCMVGVSTKTVKRCVKTYNESGLAGIRQLHYKGPKSRVEPHRSSIEASFALLPPRTSNEAAARIEDLTGIKLSPGRALAFMKRIGMKCLRMGHQPAKADCEKQRTFHDETLKPLIDEAKSGACHLFYMDAAHFILTPFVCMVWCFCRVFLKSTAGRNRINVLGAINATTHQLETVINTSYITSTEVVELLTVLSKKYAGVPIHVLLDNARYQHCAFVLEQAKELNINLVFLPSYSPNLNMIERLWKFIREKKLYAKYYADANLFHAAIRDGVHRVNHDGEWRKEVASRLGEKFQFFDERQVLC